MEKIAVLCLFGGKSTEYDVSRASATSVLENIDYNKYTVEKVGITKDGRWYYYTGSVEKISDGSWFSDEENLSPCAIAPKGLDKDKACLSVFESSGGYKIINFDVIFPVIHGANGEDGSIQGLGMLCGAPVCGADIIGSVLAYDKSLAKILCERANIPQAQYVVIKEDEFISSAEKIIDNIEQNINYPVFVKPTKAGSSIGITKAIDRKSLLEGIKYAFSYDNIVIAEEFIKGREIEISVIGGGTEEITVASCGEIKPNAEFYDYNTKYINDTAEYFIPADISKEISSKIAEYAKTVYLTLGITGFARIDFFLRGNEIIFNEINTIPGFTKISLFARLLESSGIKYSQSIDMIITAAIRGGKN